MDGMEGKDMKWKEMEVEEGESMDGETRYRKGFLYGCHFGVLTDECYRTTCVSSWKMEWSRLSRIPLHPS